MNWILVACSQHLVCSCNYSIDNCWIKIKPCRKHADFDIFLKSTITSLKSELSDLDPSSTGVLNTHDSDYSNQNPMNCWPNKL